MKNIKTRFVLLLMPVLAGFSTVVYAQQQIQRAMYSQYNFNPTASNPSWSATDTTSRITALSRFQWVGFDGAPQTHTFTLTTPLPNQKTSVGFMIINDRIGVEQETGAFFTLAQRVRLSDKSYMSAGFTGGAGYYTGNFSQLSDTDPVFVNDRQWRSNVGLGVSYFRENFYLGVSIPYLYQFSLGGETSNSIKVATDYYLMSAYEFAPSYRFKIKPTTFIRYAPGQPIVIDGNLNFFIGEEGKGVWLGAGYRSNAAVNVMFQIDLTPKIKFGYSADFATTKLYNRQSGTHEITLNYRFNLFGKSDPLF